MKIRCKSITYAMKAKDILEKNGISSYVVKDFKPSDSGCVYAVSFSDRYKQQGVTLLRDKIVLHATENWSDLA